MTTIVITQRPALLNLVDKILILRNGRAEAFGPPRDVLHRLVKQAETARSTEMTSAASPALVGA